MQTERQRAMLRAMGLRVWAPLVTPDADPLPLPEAAAAAPPPRVVEPPPPIRQPAATTARTPSGAPASTPAAAPAPVRTAALRADVAGLDWPQLREAVAACRACGLCESRSQTVFGTGHPQAHWMVVGEAPGEQEDRQGEPFVGPSGLLLDRMLAALQLTRADDGPPAERVYIANTLKCRPPRNRNPAPDELAQCEPFLLRQIELVRPRLILAMGRFAVQALLRSDAPIGRLRGQVHRYHGVPLVVTYHPAYLLRTLADKAKAWDDLCLAAGVVRECS
ncbi:DNA polymerase [Rubrivivax sp. A210]|uniref:uracil-DNA glycosylase n=1 Tax=Rubrivivax sp. A210 TaxID=2772301 RepID=UPI00191B7047|nr:uracil-DNA glycosylase [Rubrivivax sp. A210]CAD5374185.1 DNA polymerase [Rubrivivax sp. A210]